jgi:PmbA protein
MIPLSKLRTVTREALTYVSAQSDVAEAEVFASANGNFTVRLNYTSHIPSNGVEEVKSVESYGLGLRVAFRSTEGVRIGFGSEPTDLSLDGVQRALDKARQGAVRDPEYISLPMRPQVGGSGRSDVGASTRGAAEKYHDPVIMRMSNGRLVGAGWRMVDRALEVFQSSEDLLEIAESPETLGRLGLILGGDLVALQERMAIASTHIPRVQTDESTLLMSSATAMVEQQAAKGSGWSVGSRWLDFDGESAAEAARNAIDSMGGVRISTGAYRVILGPQALAEILEWILMPGLRLDMLYAGVSPFMGRLGQSVSSSQLNIYDDGAAPGLAASKAITDEGLPTGRTDLIQDGVLAGFLSDHYNTQRILHDPRGRDKLGVDPNQLGQAIAPRNGFRPGNGGGRDFASPPGIVPTNLIVHGNKPMSREELLRTVGDGVYIGRIWYTYPINGLSAGDFSGTVVGDSYVIRDGRLAEPIRPNTLRMNDNVLRVINNVIGVGSQRRPTVRWSSDQVTWAPELAVGGFELEEISEDLDMER